MNDVYSLSDIISFCAGLYSRVLDAFLQYPVLRYQYLLIIVSLAVLFIVDFIRSNRK